MTSENSEQETANEAGDGDGGAPVYDEDGNIVGLYLTGGIFSHIETAEAELGVDVKENDE